jgi:hypothetical protein
VTTALLARVGPPSTAGAGITEGGVRLVADPNDITLGEVWRGLQSLTMQVGSLRSDLKRDLDAQINDRQLAQDERIGRLEKIVYGAVGLILIAFATAVIGLVIQK